MPTPSAEFVRLSLSLPRMSWSRWTRQPREFALALSLVAFEAFVLSYALITFDYGVRAPVPISNAERYFSVWLRDSQRGTSRGSFSQAEATAVDGALQGIADTIATSVSRSTVSVAGSSARMVVASLSASDVAELAMPGIGAGQSRTDEAGAAINLSAAAAKRLGIDRYKSSGSVLRVSGKAVALSNVFDDRFGWAGADAVLVAGASERTGPYSLVVKLAAPRQESRVAQQVLSGVTASGTPTSSSARVELQPLADSLYPGARKSFAELVALSGAAAVACVLGLFGVVVVRERRMAPYAHIQQAIGQTPRIALCERLADYALVFGVGGAIGVAASYLTGEALQVVLPRNFLPKGALMQLDNSHVWRLALMIALSALVAACVAHALSSAVASRTPVVAVFGERGLRRILGASVVLQVAVATCVSVLANWYRTDLVVRDRMYDQAELRGTYVADYDSALGTRLLSAAEEIERTLSENGVSAVAAFTAGGFHPLDLATTGVASAPGEQPFKEAAVIQMTPHYLKSKNLRILRGRGIETGDEQSRRQVALISQALAREIEVAGRSALGAQIFLPEFARFRAELASVPFEVVGIVEDASYFGCKVASCPTVYIPSMVLAVARTLVLRVGNGHGPVEQLQGILEPTLRGQAALESVASRVAIRVTDQARARMRLSLAAMALMLGMSALSVFAAADAAAQQAMPEQAMRSALGASPWSLAARFGLSRGRSVALGTLAGMAGARLLETRFLPVDQALRGGDYAAACLVIGAVSAMAIAPTLRRVWASEPMRMLDSGQALRHV